MKDIVIHSQLWDVGQAQDINAFIEITHDHWQNGADVVLFPEYAPLSVAMTRDFAFDVREFADHFWTTQFPHFEKAFRHGSKMVVLGSVPAKTEKGLVNRALIYANGKWVFQDKLCMTPWEHDFVPGNELRIIDFHGVRCAVLICLDIEIPTVIQTLKKQGDIDLVLVPSATESLVGVERIARCASAAAVKLGCAVATCALTGSQGEESFAGSCLGRTAFYLPAVSLTAETKRVDESAITVEGNHVHIYALNVELIRAVKNLKDETNPARLFAPDSIVIQSV